MSAGAAVAWLTLCDAPDTVWDIWPRLLSADEAARATRFVHEADRRSYVAAHALLRLMLRGAAGLPPEAWRFVTGVHGKPAIDPAQNHAGLDINLSHTRGAVACAVAPRCDVGVDIEDVTRGVAAFDLAQAYFAPEETARLRGAVDPAASFFALWTLKEAAAKALGLGLHMPLDQLVVSADGAHVRIPGADAARWQFRAVSPTPRHRLAVAVRHAEGAVAPAVAIARMRAGSDGRIVAL